MSDVSDTESLDFYPVTSNEKYDSGDDNDGEYDYMKNYTILTEASIRKHQEEDMTEICNVLPISRSHASILLCHYKWNACEVLDSWFADEEIVRKAVGLLEKPIVDPMPNARELTCGICLEIYPLVSMNTAGCGHQFCTDCWKGYINTSINDGPGCLMLRCPDPSCSAVVGQDMVNILASDEYNKKYSLYLLRSYIEGNKKTKWCPAPGCEYAVEFDMGGGNYDVCCKCSYNFCWNCTEEAHRPVDCNTVAKWILKNSAESENMNWILANSKPCPKCRLPIEKNHGCMHMTCRAPCRFEFCWLCLGAWSKHDVKTGGFYSCNRYEELKREAAFEESERRREIAKQSLRRYTHYYERWTSNESSRKKALSDLHQMQNVISETLSNKLGLSETGLQFITDAWLQIVECRQVLKWTYAYGYYLPLHEKTKRQFFEYLQGHAETALEHLHKCAEKELQCHIDDEPFTDFGEFSAKLVNLTKVTKNYFEKIVQALENGLSDFETYSGTASSKGLDGTSSGNKGKATSSNSGSDNGWVYEHWSCGHCTFANIISATECDICGRQR